MKQTWILGVALAVFLGAASAAAQHAGPADRTPGGRGNCTEALVAALGLTSDQQTALDTLRTQTGDAISAIVTQERALHDQIETALSAASPDRCAIGDLVISGYKLRQQIAAIVTSAEAAFVASLTSDQKTKYTAFLAANPGCSAIPSHPAGPPAG